MCRAGRSRSPPSGITMALNGFAVNENHGGIKEREHVRPTVKITTMDGLCLQLHVTSGLNLLARPRSCKMMLEGSHRSVNGRFWGA